MKSGKIIWLCCLLCSVLSVSAQRSNVEVSGVVIDAVTKEPIEQATVRLLQGKDSAMVRGVASANDGAFVLKNIKPGNYILHLSFVGYESLYKALQISGKNNSIQLGKLPLSDASIHLAEAVVVGKAAEVVVRNDTVEYNADSYKMAEGSVLEDLLKKMPGVEVSSDGKVTHNGKEITKIMVDGKEFFTNDPKVASKNLPSKMIDKVQVLEKKSDMAVMTGFDDGQEETVINLTVKPGMKQGWFGNAYAGYGSKDRYEGNAMLNRFMSNDQITVMGGANNTNNMGFSDLSSSMFGGMRGGRRGGGGAGSGITSSGNFGVNFSKEFNPKSTLGGNVNYSHSDNDARSKSNQENILPGDSSYIENDQVMSRTKGDNVRMNLHAEWKPDTLTRIIFRPGFSFSHSDADELGKTLAMDNWNDTINTRNSNNSSNGNGYDVDARLEFSRKLNSKGRVFSASLSGGVGDSYNQGLNYSDIRYYRAEQSAKNEVIDQKYRFDNNSFNYRAYVSWVEPLGRNNFLQMTYSFSQRKQESLKNSLTKDNEGNYAVLDTANSNSYRNNFFSQRVSLSFKAQRQKYTYTFGLNLDPSYSRSESFVGDTVLSKLNRRVVNLSPMANFNYKFGKTSALMIRYNGTTSQPSMSQLQPVPDVSDPLNVRVGNPDLKPRYTNNLFIHYHKFEPKKQQALMFMVMGSYVLNDIVSYSTYNQNGGRLTTYKNVNGNFNGSARAVVNTPLKNRKFSVNSMSMAMYANSKGFINGEKNTNKNVVLSERAGLDFRSSYLDLGINGNVRYNQASNTLQAQSDRKTWNYGVGGTTAIYLPLDIKLESDISWSSNSGYADGFKQNEVLWNASASKSFLKNNQGTLRFKIYDILQQRSNISRSVTASSTTDTEYNTLNSYFMFHFIYRFSIFKGGANAGDMHRPRGFHGGMRPGGF